ncbi:unnamed protein product [Candidula unifasciata]|uniref:carbonyl reductase (NADPH) n=1 Tax=Candidula unifasciata TaxID=100452 RepID=A0A8S3ZFJ2_9EUPU|nr:unnamed protein product [Candidula unifasciata]
MASSARRKVAVVTGANKGIGFGIVRGLCKQFHGDVLLTARNEDRGRKAVEKLEKEGLHPKFHQLDITDHQSVVRLAEFLRKNYSGLDVLVNNAAIAYEFNDVPTPPFPEEAMEVCHVNYFSTLDVCQVLFPLLQPHARVCNVSSINNQISLQQYSRAVQAKIKDPNITLDGVNALVRQFIQAAQANKHLEQGFDNSAYGMSKIAVTLMTSIQQKELDKKNADDVVVNSCCPGVVVTDLWTGSGVSIDKGAKTPLYCALLPPNVKTPRGKFLINNKIYDWLNV